MLHHPYNTYNVKSVATFVARHDLVLSLISRSKQPADGVFGRFWVFSMDVLTGGEQ